MSRFDLLPADQKAVLQLLLTQQKSYDDLAAMLRTTGDQVRERALMALDALGPGAVQGLTDDEADEIADYLLSQQSASERAATRDLLERSAPGREWARAIAGELRGLAGDKLPDIPSEPAETEKAFDALKARETAQTKQKGRSKTGGYVLLAGAGALLAALILFATNVIGGDDDEGDESASTGTQTTATTSTTAAGETKVEAQINMRPPSGSESKALGVVQVVSQGGVRALAVAGQNLQASNYYAVWLRNGSKTRFLGFAPAVSGSGEAKGQLGALAELKDNLSDYKEILLTREKVKEPKSPGTVVLTGATSSN